LHVPKAPERLVLSLLTLALLGGCRDRAVEPIHVSLGPSPNDTATLSPRAAIAELIEISPTESALLLTLSSAPRSCDAPAAPEPDAIGVSLRLTLPGGAKLAPGRYPMLSAPSVDKPSLLATVKLRGRRQELRPGGDLQLTTVDLNPQGVLEGRLAFEFSGDVEQPATRVSGRFLAHFCRINRLR
jgi:hypothetical protein